MDELAGLLVHRLDHVGMRVSEQVDCDPGDQVEIFATRIVVDHAASTAHERDRQPPAGLHQVAVRQL